MLKRLSSIFILLFAVSAFGGDIGERQLLRINQFAGLNTRSGDFAVKPNECRIAHNIDWSRNVGSITKRYGYEGIGTIVDLDSVIAIYPAYFSDGTQRMVYVEKPTATDYGRITVSPEAGLLGGHYRDTVALFFQDGDNRDTCYYGGTATIAYQGDTTTFDFLTGYDDAYVLDFLVDSINTNLTGLTATSGDSTEMTGPGTGCSSYDKYVMVVVYDSLDEDEPVTYSTGECVRTFPFFSLRRGLTIDGAAPIWSYFSTQHKPSFAMYNDRVYIVNGTQKGVVYDGEVARSFPLCASGEPMIIPLDADGELDGEYRYAFTYARGTGGDPTRDSLGVVSAPIRVKDGRALLLNFSWVPGDTITASPDSLQITVWRTKANQGALDEGDYAFKTGASFWVETDSAIGCATVIDSIADSALTGNDSICLVSPTRIGLDSSGSYNHRYGAPGYVETDSILAYTKTGTATDTTCAYGIYHGIPEQADTLGVMYAVSYMDTITSVQSAVGPSLAVFVPTDSQNTGSKAYSYRVNLPSAPYGDTGIVKNLWRAHILEVTYDTLEFHADTNWRENNDGSIEMGYIVVADEGYGFGWRLRLAVDTIITSQYYLLAQISADSAAYTDSIRWDSLQTRMMYTNKTPPTGLDNIFSFDGRMFGTHKSRLYFSRLDSAAAWGAFDFVSLNESDGDEITCAYPTRGVVRVLKNHSSYNVYQDANLNWNRREVSGTYGCVAPMSHAVGMGGQYYLSDYGVVCENEGQYLERTQATALVSQPLANFDNLSASTKAGAVAFYQDQKYMLCIGDTTYVYDERAGAWSTWGFKFASAAMYGVEDELDFMPGDTMYFIRPGASALYRYGSEEQDDGTAFTVTWRSVPLLLDQPGYKRIDKIGIVADCNRDDDSVKVYLYDETGSCISGISTGDSTGFLTYNSLSRRCITKSPNPKTQLFYQIELSTIPDAATSITHVDDIDLWWTWLGHRITE